MVYARFGERVTRSGSGGRVVQNEEPGETICNPDIAVSALESMMKPWL